MGIMAKFLIMGNAGFISSTVVRVPFRSHLRAPLFSPKIQRTRLCCPKHEILTPLWGLGLQGFRV